MTISRTSGKAIQDSTRPDKKLSLTGAYDKAAIEITNNDMLIFLKSIDNHLEKISNILSILIGSK